MVFDGIDSSTMGDSSRFLTLTALEDSLASLLPFPKDEGTVVLIVRRLDGGQREILGEVVVSVEGGIQGDSWSRQKDRNPDAQIAVMEAGVAELIANGQPIALFGDSLFLDLDLSTQNLPEHSRVRVGDVMLNVTAVPHNGCLKFKGRFGQDALRFVSKPELRSNNLRGIYMRVEIPGIIRVGDPVIVISRGNLSDEKV